MYWNSESEFLVDLQKSSRKAIIMGNAPVLIFVQRVYYDAGPQESESLVLRQSAGVKISRVCVCTALPGCKDVRFFSK